MKCQIFSLRELNIDNTKINQEVIDVVKILQRKGYQTYLVGGAVRDLLLGLDPKDYDVATSATPEQVRRLFKRAWIIGRRFRLVCVRLRKELIEVSTFRKAPNKQAILASGQVLEDNIFGTAEEDAYRRDLTINALMLDPKKMQVLDYVNGIKDIKHKRLKIIGKPEQRYNEDPVRMMRVLRLAAKLDCTVTPSSLSPLRKLAPLIHKIPPARLFDEFKKMIFSKMASTAYKYYWKHGLAVKLFPHMKNFDSSQLEFIDNALRWTDQLTRKNLHKASLSFVISALFWPAIRKKWLTACQDNKGNMNLMMQLYNNCGIEDNLIVPKSLRHKTREIWQFQSRFYRLIHRPKAMNIHFEEYATRKAMDFLRLRSENDEIESDLYEWWSSFAELNQEEQAALVKNKSTKKQK